MDTDTQSSLIDPVCKSGTIQPKRTDRTGTGRSCRCHQLWGVPRIIPASFAFTAPEIWNLTHKRQGRSQNVLSGIITCLLTDKAQQFCICYWVDVTSVVSVSLAECCMRGKFNPMSHNTVCLQTFASVHLYPAIFSQTFHIIPPTNNLILFLSLQQNNLLFSENVENCRYFRYNKYVRTMGVSE